MQPTWPSGADGVVTISVSPGFTGTRPALVYVRAVAKWPPNQHGLGEHREISGGTPSANLHDALWGLFAAVYGSAVHPSAEDHAAMANAALPIARQALGLPAPDTLVRSEPVLLPPRGFELGDPPFFFFVRHALPELMATLDDATQLTYRGLSYCGKASNRASLVHPTVLSRVGQPAFGG